MTSTTPLPQRAAVQLAHALVSHSAASVAADALVIKGVAGSHHGLTAPWESADVDVLARPAAARAIGAELIRRGWRARHADEDTTAFPRHSVSYFHASWPCDIDVHDRFPGLEADADAVFAQLWSGRESIVVAGHDIAIPNELDTILVAAAHVLRTPTAPAFARDLQVVSARLAHTDPAALVERATTLGALACLRPALEPYVRLREAAWGSPSDEWILRTLGDPLARRIAAFVRADGGERRRALRTALWPATTTLVKDGVALDLDPAARLGRILRRWLRGAAALPSAALRAHRFLRHESAHRLVEGVDSTYAVVDGEVFAWGRNDNGQLGLGMSSAVDVPTAVPGIRDAVSVWCRERSVFAVLRDGSVLAWGQNDLGQLRDGTTRDAWRPAVSAMTPRELAR